MAAAFFPLSTSPPLLTRRPAAGLEHSRRPPRGQHGGCSARRLPAAATAGATRGLTRRATAAAAAAAQGRALAGEGAEEGSLQMVLLSTAVAVCGSFEFGTCVGYSAPAQAGIVGDIGLSNSQYGIFASVLTVGAMVGALTSGRLADTLGRKMTMRLAAIVGIFGWLAIYLAKGATMLCLGRILLGYCTGVLSYVVPVFISEIAPKDLRGGLAASNQLFICSGCSASYIIGATIPWRSLVIVGLLPCVFLLVGLPFIPESPRWLANIGREKEFRASLQKLRGEKAEISGEATEIIVGFYPKLLHLSTYNLGKRIFQKNNLLFLCRRTWNQFRIYLRPGFRICFTGKICMQSFFDVQVGVGLKVFQQLGGINALGFYTSYIFSSAGFSGKLGTTLIGIIQIPITLLGALLMDRSGRRTLLLVSSSGTFVGCFLTGLSFYFKAQGLYTQLVPTLALYGILVQKLRN
ncbi:hypothetical protein CFC21_089491 [Triticum aestivum]|uniref:Major facilitator superfamily (MFS) profile domain-containing protein n=2 Tax=Triticum aestivum TaxID=4565 RepID=A0A3B6PSW5_WHEAT|nr:hypothetical protein CFC21_089491 [Triticum aestivum]